MILAHAYGPVQGTKGDTFYIVKLGSLDVMQAEHRTVGPLGYTIGLLAHCCLLPSR